MPLTKAEQERVRYHMGYPQVQPAASIQFGLPRPIQTAFLLETAMSNILLEAEERIRRILTVMDGVECRLENAQTRLAATRLGDLEIRQDETNALEREYFRWACRLADIIAVPLYAYSERFKRFISGVNGAVIG